MLYFLQVSYVLISADSLTKAVSIYPPWIHKTKYKSVVQIVVEKNKNET